MRKQWVCVPMIPLCLLLCGCGDKTGDTGAAETARAPYQTMASCSMTAKVLCGDAEEELCFTLRCDYVAEGDTTVEVLAPETVAGVKAILRDGEMTLRYEGDCLSAGTLSDEEISPAACLPRLISALRDGWLLEENREDWGEEPCLRLGLDQTGAGGDKIVSTIWLRESDAAPVRGEIAVDGEKILQAEFTNFEFGAILDEEKGQPSTDPNE